MAIEKRDVVGKPITEDYEHPLIESTHLGYSEVRRRPPFRKQFVPAMETDPRVSFGLFMIKGPILTNARFYVKDGEQDDPAKPSQLKRWVIREITRFWRNSAVRALQAVEWGYHGSEVLYNLDSDGTVRFDTLKDIHPLDVAPLTLHGKKVGVSVKRNSNLNNKRKIYIGGPKSFWHVHQREKNMWFGRSRLFGAYEPWLDLYTDGGIKDVRRLHFRKYSLSGDVIYYPQGGIPDPNNPGVFLKPNKQAAQEILEKRKSGGTIAFPGTVDENGNRLWELIEGGRTGGAGPDILEAHRQLYEELWEGMGIPPEVAQAEGTGAYAGRRIPQQSFYGILHEIVAWLISDFDQQILRPMIRMNFGIMNPEYEIVPFGLVLGNIEESEDERKAQTAQADTESSGKDAEMSLDPLVSLALADEFGVPQWARLASRYAIAV